MFTPLTPEIENLAKKFSKQILELESVFDRPTKLYLDYANLKNWATRLQWKIDMGRLIQLVQCFDTISEARLYYGTIPGETASENRIQRLRDCGYVVVTKPVKFIKLSVDVSSIRNSSSSEILKNFISPELLRELKLETVEYLNERLRELNKQGIFKLQHMKCNFDVEIGSDMRLDNMINTVQGYSLWSGDSDFADPVSQLLRDGRKVTLFATARKVSSELNELQKNGLYIYEISKMRDFVEEKGVARKCPQTPRGLLAEPPS